MISTNNAICLFAGAGGDTLGLTAAGYNVIAYSENNTDAIATHTARFPESTLLRDPTTGSTDIRKIPDATFAAYRGSVELIMAGFPCFTAGTLVLTEGRGYVPIESVSLTDRLLTHTGIFRPIVNLQQKLYPGTLHRIRLKYHPQPIEATEEHPFYVRTKHRQWDNTQRKYITHYSTPQWKTAKELTPADYVGMTINTAEVIPTIAGITLSDPQQWFFLGYFVGNGWVQRKTNAIRIAIPTKKATILLPQLQEILPLTDKGETNTQCVKVGCANATWATLLSEFGKYAHGKFLPEWVQSAPRALLQEFVRGIMEADGTIRKDNKQRIVTVSPNLAFNLQRIYLKLGIIASVTRTIRPSKTVINGRIVNQRDTYQIETVIHRHLTNRGFIDTTTPYAWFGVAEVSTFSTDTPVPVYNFEVETDNSYVVENAIVHNCQGFSHAGKKKADDPRNELVYEFVRVTQQIQPLWIIGENVRGLLSRKARDPHQPPTAPLRPVIEIIRDIFFKIGYTITYNVVDAVNVGVPQKRKRLLIVGFRTPRPETGVFWYPHVPWDRVTTPPATPPTVRAFLESHLDGAVPFTSPVTAPSPHFWIPTTATIPTGTPHPNLVRLANGIRNRSSAERLAAPGAPLQIVEPEGLLSFGSRKGSYHGEIIDPDSPAKTIICTYGLCPRLFVGLHNAATNQYWVRCLSLRELAQIQGFPADYPWSGSHKAVVTQIGNAVPPPLGMAIGKLLRETRCSRTPQSPAPPAGATAASATAAADSDDDASSDD